jgi:hypothetical protein
MDFEIICQAFWVTHISPVLTSAHMEALASKGLIKHCAKFWIRNRDLWRAVQILRSDSALILTNLVCISYIYGEGVIRG